MQGRGKKSKKQTIKFIETSVKNKPAVKAPVANWNQYEHKISTIFTQPLASENEEIIDNKSKKKG